jgi:hypothetical protein
MKTTISATLTEDITYYHISNKYGIVEYLQNRASARDGRLEIKKSCNLLLSCRIFILTHR